MLGSGERACYARHAIQTNIVIEIHCVVHLGYIVNIKHYIPHRSNDILLSSNHFIQNLSKNLKCYYWSCDRISLLQIKYIPGILTLSPTWKRKPVNTILKTAIRLPYNPQIHL